MFLGNHFKRIKLKRTLCQGTCPDFDINISHIGEVVYQGRFHVKKKGKHVWYLEQSSIDRLNAAIEKCDYFNIGKRKTLVLYTCSPECHTMVELENGQIRSIERDSLASSGWPRSLAIFENQVEEIVGITDYV